MKNNTDVSAAAMLKYACQYHEAVEGLSDGKAHLSRPINALYFHTVELALKVYLRAHGRDPWGHEIRNIYNECRALGLKIRSNWRSRAMTSARDCNDAFNSRATCPSLAVNKVLDIIFLSSVEAIPGVRSRAWDASRLFRR